MLAYAHIEKCGGTCLIDLLRRSYGLRHCDVIPRDAGTMVFGPRDATALVRRYPFVRSVSGHSIRLASNLQQAIGRPVSYLTCLREPIGRYLSEYSYFIDRLGAPAGFELWLQREDRHNFQTRSIAGTDDVDVAKEILLTRFSAVGVLEEFDDFLKVLGNVALKATGLPLRRDFRVRNSRGQRRRQTRPPELTGRQRRLVRDANAKDLELYDFVVSELAPAQLRQVMSDPPATIAPKRSAIIDALSLAAYKAHRNLVYKPSVGRWPIPHRLPAYEKHSVNPRRAAA